MLHVVLFQPEIAPNTGNVGRMCALTRSRLHLIHPLGFVINDRNLRRAGMDYWRSLDVHEHADWRAFRASPLAPKRLWLFTTKTDRTFWDVQYEDEDGLVFGNEGSGARTGCMRSCAIRGSRFRTRTPVCVRSISAPPRE